MLDAHDRELQRTQKLVEIGAASRQALERIHAEHAAQTATVESARSQLELLGLTVSALDNPKPGQNVTATTSVLAPIDGVVTERAANVALNASCDNYLRSSISQRSGSLQTFTKGVLLGCASARRPPSRRQPIPI
jgi:hypothetical protein